MGVATVVAEDGVVFHAAYDTVINPGFLDAQRATCDNAELSSQLLAVGVGSLIFGPVLSAVLGMLLRSRVQD